MTRYGAPPRKMYAVSGQQMPTVSRVFQNGSRLCCSFAPGGETFTVLTWVGPSELLSVDALVVWIDRKSAPLRASVTNDRVAGSRFGLKRKRETRIDLEKCACAYMRGCWAATTGVRTEFEVALRVVRLGIIASCGLGQKAREKIVGKCLVFGCLR